MVLTSLTLVWADIYINPFKKSKMYNRNSTGLMGTCDNFNLAILKMDMNDGFGSYKRVWRKEKEGCLVKERENSCVVD